MAPFGGDGGKLRALAKRLQPIRMVIDYLNCEKFAQHYQQADRE